MNTIPRWYVREDTIAGELYFYPVPAVTETDGFNEWTRRSVTWSSVGAGLLPVEVEERGGYLVTREAVRSIAAQWPAPAKVGHYALRAPGDLDPIAASFADRVPEVVTIEEYRRVRCEYGTDCGECTWCSFRGKLYKPVSVAPSTRSATFDLSHLEELANTPDPHPERSWKLDSPPLAALYPERAAHLFPGYTTGVFAETAAATQEAMNALGIPRAEVNVWRHSMEVSVTCKIPWDVPREWVEAKGRGRATRQTNRERQDKALFGIPWRESIKINDRVAGVTKADAVEKMMARVAQNVAALVPPHTKVCGNCSGHGYIA